MGTCVNMKRKNGRRWLGMHVCDGMRVNKTNMGMDGLVHMYNFDKGSKRGSTDLDIDGKVMDFKCKWNVNVVEMDS